MLEELGLIICLISKRGAPGAGLITWLRIIAARLVESPTRRLWLAFQLPLRAEVFKWGPWQNFQDP